MAGGYLADLPGIRDIFKDGVAIAIRNAVNFKGSAWGVVDNTTTGQTDITFTQGAATDPVSGFESVLLPQFDTTVQTTNATPSDLATIALIDNTVYTFSAYCQAYAAAYAQETVQMFDQLTRRSNAGGATRLQKNPGVEINPLVITGLTLVESGNNVIVRWTGHASTTLKARVQVAYVSRPIVLPV
jgi:hypothetical protein